MSDDMAVEPAHRPSTKLRAPLGTGTRWPRRLLLHHLPVALVSAVALLLFTALSLFTSSFSHGDSSGDVLTLRLDTANESFVSQLTIATGYVATVLLALTLLIGPFNLLLRRRNPLSSYLRRDLGTWTAIFSLAHVILAFDSAYRGAFSFLDFFVADGRPLTNSFGLGNWTGLAALVIVVGLLAISTNRSVRELKGRRWKSLQRLNYTLFALVVLHAVFYGALMRITSPFTLLLIGTVVAVLLGQAAGIRLWRRRQSPPDARPTLA
jgi:sulfoxide reductase heme-binding subunit YedZ